MTKKPPLTPLERELIASLHAITVKLRDGHNLRPLAMVARDLADLGRWPDLAEAFRLAEVARLEQAEAEAKKTPEEIHAWGVQRGIWQ